MNKIGIIGDADSVLGFKVFGMDAFACETGEEAAETLHRIVKENYGIIYITERFYKELGKDIAKYEELRYQLSYLYRELTAAMAWVSAMSREPLRKRLEPTSYSAINNGGKEYGTR